MQTHDRLPPHPAILILAYGNPLRGDDGVGWQAAMLLEKQLGDQVEVITRHQLTPELAEVISRAERVVFIDAACEGIPGEVLCQEVQATTFVAQPFTHHVAPGDLLSAAQELFGHAPQGHLITINGGDFGFHEGLSTPVEAALPEVVAYVERVIQHRRLALSVSGSVQGVGFRPFVYRLATELQLTGWVLNSAQGVFIEVEGKESALAQFRVRLERETPPQASIQRLSYETLPPAGYTNFEIRQSKQDGPKTTLVLPDVATCPDCLAEIFDPEDRRYGYPFTNCTNCGPRYSIIEGLPYDRAQTSMRGFTMCPRCQTEYEDPTNRRFHAQPNACPTCGPQLAFWDSNGILLAEREVALRAAADALRSGWIIAVKGMGGFHLFGDARSGETVEQLRRRKHRPSKPLAIMLPNLEEVERHCELSPQERVLLSSSAAPIVLLRRRDADSYASTASSTPIAGNVAPGNRYLGVMLPYTPLHHLLMAKVGFPLIATSGNLSDEPICTDETEALERLHGIADFFLVHNRPIVRSVDDSVAQVVGGDLQILRRSRGYAPLPLAVDHPPQTSILAVGAHLKNTVALSKGEHIFLSQHIGDLETPQSYAAFRHTVESLCRLYGAEPETIACDAHPDYLSSQYAVQLAAERNLPLRKVQHHYAHVLACMAEHKLKPPVLGLSWDGTGYGEDGTIWGGEFLLVTETGYERVAHLRPFPLPGGDAAVREPRRSAIGLLYERFGDRLFEWEQLPFLHAFSWEDRRVLRLMLKRKLNTVYTSSMGRLFDGVAALLDIHPIADFEGEAAMALQFAAETVSTTERYEIAVHDPVQPKDPMVLDWAPMIDAILADRWQGVGTGEIAARFHNTLVQVAVNIAQRIGAQQVVLTGGCFQNKLLSESLMAQLSATGHQPFCHRQVPPNDGGIALGQVMAAVRCGGGRRE
jgi:hydrogenase maturation protein HypF